MQKQYISLNGKQYSILIRDCGNVDICTEWEIPHPSDAGLVHPRMVHRYASVSPYGKLGKKILASLPTESQALINGIF
jgi:hypothetical protein